MIAGRGAFGVISSYMMDRGVSPFHSLPSGLCEDASGEAVRLIQRMAGRDAAALTELHTLWCPVLMGIALRMVGERRDADEVVRAAFERMWKRAESYDPHRMPPFVWAFVTLRGLALESLQGRRRGKSESAVECASIPVPRGALPKVLAGDDCRRLRSAMDQLEMEERICLERAVFLEYARQPDPEQPGGPSAAVKNQLRRALETICNQLSRHEL
jgi:RNA polymerase sigma-70 factor (ECF subfamily)